MKSKERLSLVPLTPEQALAAALNTPLPTSKVAKGKKLAKRKAIWKRG